jgi:hypothetical protein
MYSATSIVGAIGTCGTLLCLLGCQVPEVAKVRWQMVIAQSDGRLTLAAVEAPRIFSEPASAIFEPLLTTQSRCLAGWLDPNSAILATLERDAQGTAIRVYRGDERPYAEYRTGRKDTALDGSCPVLLADGQRVVFVDPTGNVIVADITRHRGMSAKTACGAAPSGVQPYSTIACIDDAGIAVESFEKIYRVDLRDGTCRLLGSGNLLGLVGKDLVISKYPDGLSLLDMDGGIHPFPGRSRRHHYREAPYAGYRIHRVSPDCQYLAYDASLWPAGQPTLAIQHLESGRTVYLKVPGGIRSLGSWFEVGNGNGPEAGCARESKGRRGHSTSR